MNYTAGYYGNRCARHYEVRLDEGPCEKCEFDRRHKEFIERAALAVLPQVYRVNAASGAPNVAREAMRVARAMWNAIEHITPPADGEEWGTCGE